MKRILVFAYLRNNLGDDLFVNELLKRYPNTIFYINTINSSFAKPFEKYSNAIINMVKSETFENINITNFDGCVYIGGSIFMEGGHVYNLDEQCFKFIHKCQNQNKPFFYISCNYGPYKTKNYFNLSTKTFKICQDICFRDKYSYELFKNIPSVRYAPDVAFTYIPTNVDKQKDTIGISLIDLSIRDELKYKENEHLDFLCKNISFYLQNKKKVYLFSLCEYEGDNRVIETLCRIKKEDFNNGNIKIVKYRNDIDTFLKTYQQMEYMICERFHSMVLSYLFEQKFFVISYSKKIDNIITELNLCNNFIKIEDISSDLIIDFDKFNTVNSSILHNIKINAKNQFNSLDLFLNEFNNNNC